MSLAWIVISEGSNQIESWDSSEEEAIKTAKEMYNSGADDMYWIAEVKKVVRRPSAPDPEVVDYA